MTVQGPVLSAPRFASLVKARDAAHFSPLVSVLLAVPLLAALALGFLYPVARLISLSLADGGESYLRIWEDMLFLDILLDTVVTAAIVTGLCLVPAILSHW